MRGKAASDVDRLVEDLGSEKKKTRFAAFDALDALTKKGVSPEIGEDLLRAAATTFPPQRYEFQSTQCALIRAAATAPVAAYVPILREIFPRLVGSSAFGLSDPRSEALELLTTIAHVSAARAFVELWEQALRAAEKPSVRFVQLRRQPRYPKIYFPRLFELAAGSESIAFDVFALALAYAEKGVLSAKDLTPHAHFVTDAFERLGRLPGADLGPGLGNAWQWDESYAPTRSNAALLLDLMGYLDSRKVEGILREAIGSADPRLALFAATSLLRRGKRVPSDALEHIASDAASRDILFDALSSVGRRKRFPARWATQEALAEADMVRWLTFPTELGRAPDEIELMQIVEAEIDNPPTPFRWYVFRFRTGVPHWSAGDGWLAGISGPFKCADSPTTRSYGDTFSTFAPWDSKSPDEHVEDVHALVRRWREQEP